MKIYVNEMPKSCRKCPCCNHEYEGGLTCNLGTFDDEYYSQHISMVERKRHKDCPLHSLSDYKQEVVKEVCEKIKKNCENEDFVSYTDLKVIIEILDQIEKGEL